MSVPQSEITTFTGLARKLVESGLLSPEAAEAAFNQFLKKERKSFDTYLIENKLVRNCRDLALAVAEEFGVPVVDLDSIDLNVDTLKRIDKKLIEKHKALPIFERGKRLFVAISDPTNWPALEEIRFHTKMNTEPVVVEADKLAKVIEWALEVFDTSMKDLGDDPADIDLVDEDTEAKAGADDESEASSGVPILKLVNKILYDSIKMGASDLHFEPYEKFYRVRFRVDGMLQTVVTPPVCASRQLAARLKVMAGLDPSERTVPQHGFMKIEYGRGSVDFRISIMPTRFGEKVVLRNIDFYGHANLNIDILGYEEEQKQLYLEALRNPRGMVLVTGPWGSGKTVSLYTGINILNQEDVNISIVEDSVEINLPGVNQVQVNEKTGMTFAKALKEFLCQDPDIIVVDEMRDSETVRLAMKAASEHLVMSTLYTNDAPATLTRLIDLGIPPFAIATTVNLITAQRLCRRLCTCKIEHKDIPDEILLREGFQTEDLERRAKGEWKLYTKNPNGCCERCNGLGYKGRVGIYQVMPISKAMKRLIMGGGNTATFANQAALEGIADLRQSGLKKVMDGFTSLEEIDRVVYKNKEKDE